MTVGENISQGIKNLFSQKRDTSYADLPEDEYYDQLRRNRLQNIYNKGYWDAGNSTNFSIPGVPKYTEKHRKMGLTPENFISQGPYEKKRPYVRDPKAYERAKLERWKHPNTREYFDRAEKGTLPHIVKDVASASPINPYSVPKKGLERLAGRLITVFDIETGHNFEPLSFAAIKGRFDKNGKFKETRRMTGFWLPTEIQTEGWRMSTTIHDYDINKLKEKGAKHTYGEADFRKIGRFFGKSILVGHNINEFDIPNLERNYGKFGNSTIDTLWALENTGEFGPKSKRGLEELTKRATGKSMHQLGLSHHEEMSDVIANVAGFEGLYNEQNKVGQSIRRIVQNVGSNWSLLPYESMLDTQIGTNWRNPSTEAYIDDRPEQEYDMAVKDRWYIKNGETIHEGDPRWNTMDMLASPQADMWSNTLGKLADALEVISDAALTAGEIASGRKPKPSKSKPSKPKPSKPKPSKEEIKEVIEESQKIPAQPINTSYQDHEDLYLAPTDKALMEDAWRETVNTFRLGGGGGFDALAAEAIRDLAAATNATRNLQLPERIKRRVAGGYTIDEVLEELSTSETIGAAGEKQIRHLYDLHTARYNRQQTEKEEKEAEKEAENVLLSRQKKIDSLTKNAHSRGRATFGVTAGEDIVRGITPDMEDFDKAIVEATDKLQDMSKGFKIFTGLLSDLKNIMPTQLYSPGRMTELENKALGGMLQASSGFIPGFLQRPLGFGVAAAQQFNLSNWFQKQYQFQATQKSLDVARAGLSTLGGAIGLAAGPGGAVVGSILGDAIGRVPSTISQIRGAKKEADFNAFASHLQGDLNAISMLFTALTAPLKLFGAALNVAVKGLKLFGVGIGYMQELGTPLTNLSGIGYGSFQRHQIADVLSGVREGTSSSATESWGTQHALLWSMGQMDTGRMQAAAMLGVLPETYFYKGTAEEGRAAAVDKIYNRMLRADARGRERIMAQVGVLDPSMHYMLQTMQDLGAKSYSDFVSGKPMGVSLYQLSDAERGRFRTDVAQWRGHGMAFKNSIMRLTDKAWNAVGNPLFQGLNRGLHTMTGEFNASTGQYEGGDYAKGLGEMVDAFKNAIKNMKEFIAKEFNIDPTKLNIATILNKALSSVKLNFNTDFSNVFKGLSTGLMGSIKSFLDYINSFDVDLKGWLIGGKDLLVPKKYDTYGKDATYFGSEKKNLEALRSAFDDPRSKPVHAPAGRDLAMVQGTNATKVAKGLKQFATGTLNYKNHLTDEERLSYLANFALMMNEYGVDYSEALFVDAVGKSVTGWDVATMITGETGHDLRNMLTKAKELKNVGPSHIKALNGAIKQSPDEFTSLMERIVSEDTVNGIINKIKASGTVSIGLEITDKTSNGVSTDTTVNGKEVQQMTTMSKQLIGIDYKQAR